MNIGILTHPQDSNYGGILQCYALNTFLRKFGYNTLVINRVHDDKWFKPILRSLLKLFHHPRYYHKGEIDVNVNIRVFVTRMLNRTKPIKSQCRMFRVCKQYKLDAVIVGSDQVWRYDYALNYGYNYFLDFVPDHIVKLSYAASFALPAWRYSEVETARISSLLSRFKAISVREEDAVALCKDYLDVDATWLLDPTILLDVTDYDAISSKRLLNSKYVFIYWLGDEDLAVQVIENYKTQGYDVVYISLRANRIKPSIEDWLSYIKYADIVYTDSFHGCVFSILYMRHLVMSPSLFKDSRTVSLFNLLGLQMGEICKSCYTCEVVERINDAREKSKIFLTQNLK